MFFLFAYFTNSRSLSSTPWNTSLMPNSVARRATAFERRPDRMALGTPAAASILMPWPS